MCVLGCTNRPATQPSHILTGSVLASVGEGVLHNTYSPSLSGLVQPNELLLLLHAGWQGSLPRVVTRRPQPKEASHQHTLPQLLRQEHGSLKAVT